VEGRALGAGLDQGSGVIAVGAREVAGSERGHDERVVAGV
jgi:hypothetical protein